jgi:very-short-patch-repair endonuclease
MMSRPVRGKTSTQIVLAARRLRGQLTDSEQVLWDALRDNRLSDIKFRRQHPFGPYVLDFFCVKAQLDVELDGSVHNQPGQREYDNERTSYLEAQGVRVLRFRNEDVADRLDEVMMRILEAASPTPLTHPQPPPSPDILSGEGGAAEGRGG